VCTPGLSSTKYVVGELISNWRFCFYKSHSIVSIRRLSPLIGVGCRHSVSRRLHVCGPADSHRLATGASRQLICAYGITCQSRFDSKTLLSNIISDYLKHFCSSRLRRIVTCLLNYAGYIILHRVRKKHSEHYRLLLKEMSTNFNNFLYKYFWHNWPSYNRPIYHFNKCLLLHYLGKNDICVKKKQKYVKKHHQHYRLWLEEGVIDFNNFWCQHFWHNCPSNDCFNSHLA